MKETMKRSTDKREGRFALIDTLITALIFSTLTLMSYHGLNGYEYSSDNTLQHVRTDTVLVPRLELGHFVSPTIR